MRRVNPLGVVVRGALAGAAGSVFQDRFFGATAAITPRSPPDAFEPPEPEQRSELQTETVARRFVEGFMKRGPLTQKEKKRGGRIVHVAFGSGWGVGYGLLAESIPGAATLPGALLYSTFVWIAGDNLLTEAFRLTGPARRYPLRVHAYALAAHMAYGVGLHTAYRSLRGKRGLLMATAIVGLPRRRRRLGKVLQRARRRVSHVFEDAGLH